MCFDEGTLQSYLDGEIDESLKEQIKKHLDTCEKCSVKLNELKNLNSFLDKALKTSSIDLNEAWENLNKKINKEERGVFHMFKKYKKYIAAAAAAAVITASIALPPVQKAEAEILSLFRLNNFKTVTITPDDLQDIKNKFYQAGNKEIDLKQYGDIKVIGDYGSSKEFSKNNLDKIKSYVGYNFKIPQDVDSFKIRDSIYVEKGQSIEFKLNVDNINNLIKTFGGNKLLPENLNEKTFKIILGNSVHISSTDRNESDSSKNISYGLDIMKTPEIIVPDGVDIEKVRDAVINMPFIPDDVRKQIASIKDWKSTIPLPVTDADTIKDVTINGSKGIVISRKFDVSSNLEVYSNLALNDNGVIYLFSGNNMSPDELIKIAESMR
ncbi:putative zinc finger protein [Thermohydrogenium kirishiense]|nr:putative zinc finger protein [Thermohydrogenium kirishiense]